MTAKMDLAICTTGPVSVVRTPDSVIVPQDILLDSIQMYADSIRKCKYKLRRGPREKRLQIIKARLQLILTEFAARGRGVNGSAFKMICIRFSPWPRRSKMDSAEQFLWKLIKRVQQHEIYWSPKLVCPECRSIPVMPVTAECGHSWCYDCHLTGFRCSCGALAPVDHSVNIVARNIIDIFFPSQLTVAESSRRADVLLKRGDKVSAMNLCVSGLAIDSRNVQLRLIRAKIYYFEKNYEQAREDLTILLSFDPCVNEAYAIMGKIFKHEKQYENALKHFFVAWLLGYSVGLLRKSMLEAVKNIFDKMVNNKSRNRFLKMMVRDIKSMAQACNEYKERTVMLPADVNVPDLICAVCTLGLIRPVTTPCGHTFCRTCVERCLDHSHGCPLCQGSIESLRRGEEIRDSEFVKVMAARLPRELLYRPKVKPGMIPLMICTTGFPTVSCSILIKEGRYRLLVRRCMRSTTRQFGMVSCEPIPGGNEQLRFSQYGTILEIKDCVTHSDGSMIVSTVGVSRFQVLRCEEFDGYDVGKVEPLFDFLPMSNYSELRRLSVTVREKAELWIRRMVRGAREDIENSFGPMPEAYLEDEDDGPAWIWWLLAAMPLTVQLKRMLLGTRQVVLRLRAIDKTLDLRKWSLREHLRRDEDYVHVEMQERPEETVIPVPVERWLISPGSIQGHTHFAM